LNSYQRRRGNVAKDILRAMGHHYEDDEIFYHSFITWEEDFENGKKKKS
jgi:hypothetical protein